MKTLIVFICILFPLFSSFAGENIVLYRSGEKDQTSWNLMKNYFDRKGYDTGIYEKPESFEEHLKNVNSINRTKASFMLVIDFRMGAENNLFIAVTDSKKVKGNFLAIEEIPGKHAVRSMEYAKCVASSYGKKVKELPLFPLLGVDVPGVFLRMECTKDGAMGTLNILTECLQKYFTRGAKNEK